MGGEVCLYGWRVCAVCPGLEGIEGVVQDEVAGQVLPKGVMRLKNFYTKKARKTDLIADSHNKLSNLMEGQLEQNYKGLASLANCDVTSRREGGREMGSAQGGWMDEGGKVFDMNRSH